MASYRNDETIARLRRMFLMLVVVGLGFGVIGLVRASISGPGPALWAGLALSGVGLICLALRRRTGDVSVETGSEGIVARNLLSTRELSWADIDAFEEGSRRRGITLAFVRTVSGREHALDGVGDGTSSARIVKALRRDLQSARKR